MKINAEKILKIQAQEFIKDADFAYDDNTHSLDNDSAHMIAQKTLLRVNILDAFLNNIVNETEMQKSTTLLSKKMLKQSQDDIDYMYPNGNLEEDNIHVVMQLIKRTGEDLSNFLECFQQKYETQSTINIVDLIKEQFKEYNNDIDYAYPHNNYEDDNAHIVLQGLLGKSEFLYKVIDNTTPVNEEERDFKTLYLDKLSGLIELLNSGYNQEGFYQNNGHDVFSQLIEGLKVEIKDLSEMKLRSNEELNHNENQKTVIIGDIHGSNEKLIEAAETIKNSMHKTPITIGDSEVPPKSTNQTETQLDSDSEFKPVRNEEVKRKVKGMM